MFLSQISVYLSFQIECVNRIEINNWVGRWMFFKPYSSKVYVPLVMKEWFQINFPSIEFAMYLDVGNVCIILGEVIKAIL